MRTTDENANVPVLDAWTPLSFKRALGNRRVGGTQWLQPTWVGNHARRLQAYDIRTALAENAARFYLEAVQDIRDQHREYGDAGLIIETILAALLGDDQHIVTEGAEDFDPDDAEPDDVDPENPPDPNAPTPPADLLAAAERAQAKKAFDFQTWIEGVLQKERLKLKMEESERNTVTLGDGVYTIGWSAKKQRPRIRVFNPGFYFPVLNDGNEDDFPDTVHVAWEIMDDDTLTTSKRRIHRLTWELVELAADTKFAWNEERTHTMCLYSDGIWEIDTMDKSVEDLDMNAADWQKTTVDGVLTEMRQIPLNIDFIPVVHIPNNVALLNHFGKSSLDLIAQILDDLANADTDLQAASATTGKPPIALIGGRLAKNEKGETIAPTYNAGQLWELNVGGDMKMVDTSTSLDALLKYVTSLLDRLSTNSRVPSAVLGRVKPGEISSGIQLLLSFGPLRSMVQKMRAVREEKYPILLKFFHRIALAGKMKDAPLEWVDTSIEFGRYLPEDVAATVTMVNQLLTSKPPAISLETAVRLLMDVGLPIEDAVDEVRRIEERDYAGAAELLAATGNVQDVYDYLGIEREAPPLPPAPVGPAPPAPPLLPPGPGPGPAPPAPPKPAPTPA